MIRFLPLLFLFFFSLEILSNDPFEDINRTTFKINNSLDNSIAKPVAKAYKYITPDALEKGISNVIFNIEDISICLNSILQGKVKNGLSDVGRIIINSSLGIGGIFDIASSLGLTKHDEDFGQTLAVWGVPHGPYVVLPILGPSTLRDAASLIPDAFLSPSIILDHERTIYSLKFLDLIDTRARYLGFESIVVGDQYLFFRDAYYQNRKYEEKDGLVEDEFDIFDDLEDLD
tara:strand:- start:1561 stop:2253 length:693 start_codon:yes stop_codon:yes gene_type:complete